METLKIEIRKQTTLGGNTYFNLYVNNEYQTLFSDFDKAQEKANQIEILFRSGAMEPQIVYSKDITK
jgi:hypothetical protein